MSDLIQLDATSPNGTVKKLTYLDQGSNDIKFFLLFCFEIEKG